MLQFGALLLIGAVMVFLALSIALTAHATPLKSIFEESSKEYKPMNGYNFNDGIEALPESDFGIFGDLEIH